MEANISERCFARWMSRLSTPRRRPMRRAFPMSVVAPMTGISAANRETRRALPPPSVKTTMSLAANLLRGAAGRKSYGDVRAAGEILLQSVRKETDTGSVVRISISGDAVQITHGFEGMFAHGAFSGEHHGVGTVPDSVGYVARLGPGGLWIFDHALQHLGRGDNGFQGLARLPDNLLLERGHLLHTEFHPQIAPRHHYAPAHVQNLLQIFQGLGMFDLGDNGLGAAQFLDVQTKRLHIGSAAHETLGEEIHAFLHTPTYVFQILGSQGIKGNIQPDGWTLLRAFSRPPTSTFRRIC